MPEIGATLREARMRARIDISDIEAETKIRAKYLRALENEEWGLLPGPAYVRSFLRTYAEALDLDAKLLLEEYKLRHERPSDHDLMPIGSPRRRGGGGRGGPVRHQEPRGVPRGVVVGVVVVLLLGALYLLGRGGGNNGGSASVGTQTSRTTTTRVPASTTKTSTTSSKKQSSSKASSSSRLVRMQVIATGPGPVSVCLVDAAGQARIPGATLQQNSTAGPYRSKSFRLKLGNGNVRLRINGKIRSVPNASPVAFTITRTTFKRVDATTAPDCAG
ncbi:MAG TPA: helix-turn-helix transcriptional regulator [Baekduia sp.]|uniref:helix-turn-helix domain-containing protein n=1 Tax=Baekduia sp. TaxID=2600305 RepID=UPI002CC046E6|nr:helix-turn-helix transcriptional regulator [Baekduia sp.]HMJ37518.1 helix-turn-helix transcriptional regulator [Baekduia sp.]